MNVYKKLEENIKIIKEKLDSEDIILREINMEDNFPKLRAFLLFIDGLADKNLIQEHIIKSLNLFYKEKIFNLDILKKKIIETTVLTAVDIKNEKNLDKVFDFVLSGDTALFIDGFDEAIIISSKGYEKRSVSESTAEAVILGPKDSFTENYRTNIVLIRRRLKDINLKIKTIKLGRHTKTDVGILYIQGIANPKLIDEVLKRLNKIDIDGIIEIGYIEQLIEDNWLSPFPQFRRTERPDVVAGSLLEGNFTIICDNTPYALIGPTTFLSLFQSAEDYYQKWYIAMIIRFLRFLALFFATSAPALYVAFTSFNPEMIPVDLLLSIASTRENVPFSSPIEALLMIIILEVLREAGVRLPGPIGKTIGIVGGLVIGEAAVKAGIVSPIMVIVIALNAISSFAIPNYSVAIAFRILTFIFLLFASIAGLFGIIMGFILILCHLVTLKSLGIAYLYPFVNLDPEKMQDVAIRAPLPFMKERPDYLQPLDQKKLNDGDKNAGV